MTVWIDEPIWPAHGRLFAHLVSDASYAELHAVAQAAGLHPRSFDGDHYDVPDALWQAVVDAGATVTTGVDLARRLNASGLRLRKRKHDRGVVRQLGRRSSPTAPSDVDLIASSEPVRESQVMRRHGLHPRRRRATSRSCTACGAGSGAHRVAGASPGRAPSRTPSVRPSRRPGSVSTRQAWLPAAMSGSRRVTDDNVIDVDRPFLQVFRADLTGVVPD